jgi:hypothetical protein
MTRLPASVRRHRLFVRCMIAAVVLINVLAAYLLGHLHGARSVRAEAARHHLGAYLKNADGGSMWIWIDELAPSQPAQEQPKPKT